MVASYLILIILICMIWYAGVEGTLRVFQYLDLELRYLSIKFTMWRMKRSLEKQLDLPPTSFSKFIEEYKNDR